ncbi:hypothetical protein I6E08_00645 [Ligilactobacillus ruminis]|uniref:hypothetical protein n=1 Tax=Ligilactobacillus ruminis TaxID=1623 RepID=UPI001F46ACB5|nr:hypothetical protein [Ligilactobacillus ruminis]MCF2543740.1 hypothetical protein [Ligilactobacillus ruminis]
MKFVEAVNLIESRYGMQAFDHLEDYSEDEAVQILLEERKQSRAKNKKKCARGKDPGAAALRSMIENGYTYVEIAMVTGLSSAAVGKISGKYGLREFYYKMHPNVRRLDVKVLCVNRSTGEQVEFKTLSAAERAFGLPHCALSEWTRNGRTFVHGDWEIKREQ